MQGTDREVGRSVRPLVKYLVAATLVDLAALAVVIFAHFEDPVGSLLLAAGVLAAGLAFLASASALTGVYWGWMTYPQHRKAIAFILVVTLVTLVAHAAILGNPPSGYIGDESFYVPEAQGLLAGQHCSFGLPNSPSNCHMEHPWLVPGLIAAGMAIFGPQNSVGWRLFPALLGTFSIPILFGIAWKLSGSKKLACLSALVLALDVMFFAQSGAAFLDIPETFFGLAAFLAYFADLKWWKFDRYVVAGVLLGLSGLSKETAVFTAAALVTYVLVLGDGRPMHRVYSSLKVVVVVGVVFAVGLQVYDSTLASVSAPTFIQQVSYIMKYGSSLIATGIQCQPTVGYFCKFPGLPGGPPILPTDWLVFYTPVAYYEVAAGNLVLIAYYGVTNLLETWTVYIWLPLIAYALYRHFSGRQRSLDQFVAEGESQPSPVPGEVRFAGFVFISFLWSYIPYIALFVAGRVTYPFYLIPAIPAMAAGTAYWISRGWFPKWLMEVYLLIAFVFFMIYFPDKAFLPVWLRTLLGH